MSPTGALRRRALKEVGDGSIRAHCGRFWNMTDLRIPLLARGRERQSAVSRAPVASIWPYGVPVAPVWNPICICNLGSFDGF